MQEWFWKIFIPGDISVRIKEKGEILVMSFGDGGGFFRGATECRPAGWGGPRTYDIFPIDQNHFTVGMD